MPKERTTKGPYTAKSGSDRIEYKYTVPREELNFSQATPPKENSPSGKFEPYYHNYKGDGERGHADNCRCNATAGNGKNKSNYVAIRPEGQEGPFKMEDLVLIDRGPSNPADAAKAIDAFKNGTATDEQIDMLKSTWKGMEQLSLNMDELRQSGLITGQEQQRIQDIMVRGHFVPGTYATKEE